MTIDKSDRKKARLMGRPIIIKDDDLESWDLIEKHAQAGCLGTSIAAKIGCCADTLYQAVERKYKMTFSAYLAQKKGEGRDILRMAQFQAAVKGNSTMLIWLGKQELGQSDNPMPSNDQSKALADAVEKLEVVE